MLSRERFEFPLYGFVHKCFHVVFLPQQRVDFPACVGRGVQVGERDGVQVFAVLAGLEAAGLGEVPLHEFLDHSEALHNHVFENLLALLDGDAAHFDLLADRPVADVGPEAVALVGTLFNSEVALGRPTVLRDPLDTALVDSFHRSLIQKSRRLANINLRTITPPFMLIKQI